MSDDLISPAVGIAMCAVSAVAIAYSVKKSVKGECFSKEKLPMMAVMSAFIFAAQMVNFAIPQTGSSGHITGGILLAAMIGAFPALLSMSLVLVVQCLFFADGGLLALGCNIFNLGVIPCLIVYPLVFEPLAKRNMALASVLSVVLGLQLGALGVVLQTYASGIAGLPFAAFAASMLPIHLAIGALEGVATAVVLYFAYAVHAKKAALAFALMALLFGGVLSQFASQAPDGLEWSIEKAESHGKQ